MTHTMRPRKLLLFIAIISLGVLGTACDLLDASPEQSFSFEDAFETQSAAQAAVNGMYDGFQQTGTYGGFYVPMSDFTANNANFGGSFTTWQAAQAFNLNANHGPTEGMWTDFYDTINRANNVLERSPGLVDREEADQEFVDGVTAEAKFVRALAHFNLVRLFSTPYSEDPQSPGVPVVTSSTSSPNDDLDLGRGTVEDVYSQIVTDLQDVRDNENAPSAGDVSGYRGSSEAATALLAKVRLYQENYSEARDLAENVIDSGAFSMAGTPSQLFEQQGGSSETIFAVQFSEIDNTGVNDHPSSFYTPSDFGGRGDIIVSSSLLDIIEEDDLRGPGGIMYEYDGDVWTDKWSSGSSLGDDALVLRLAEMYLIAAEGHARTADNGGSESQAREYLNEVRERAEASEAPGSLSGQDLIDAIIQERRIELAFEADRRHDVLRLGLALESPTASAPQEQRIFPIPSREIDVNDSFSSEDQNPGY